jgi:hypothetical protein
MEPGYFLKIVIVGGVPGGRVLRGTPAQAIRFDVI